MIDDRLPVIVATGQVAERDGIVSPLELMARAADLRSLKRHSFASRYSTSLS